MKAIAAIGGSLPLEVEQYAARAYATALNPLRKVLGRAPDSAEAWFLLGLAASRLGQERPAAEYFNRAMALDLSYGKLVKEEWSRKGR